MRGVDEFSKKSILSNVRKRCATRNNMCDRGGHGTHKSEPFLQIINRIKIHNIIYSYHCVNEPYSLCAFITATIRIDNLSIHAQIDNTLG